MISFKRGIILFVFIVWCALCWHRYTCTLKGFCYQSTLANEKPKANFHGNAFLFESSSYSAVQQKGFQAYCDSMQSILKKEHLVQIIGIYYASEKNSSPYKNLGLARANAIKNCLGSNLDTSLFIVRSKLSTAAQPSGFFKACETHVELKTNSSSEGIANNSVKPSSPILLAQSSSKVSIEPNQLIVIPFEAKAVHRIESDKTNDQLSQIAKLIKTNGKSVSIIGFSSKNEAIELGRIRAWVIKKELLTHGIPSAQLMTSSEVSDEKNSTQIYTPIHSQKVIIRY